MNYTTFNTEHSLLTTFDTIGYDKNSKTLHILFFDGEHQTYYDISESIIFNFLISYDKEAFFNKEIKRHSHQPTN